MSERTDCDMLDDEEAFSDVDTLLDMVFPPDNAASQGSTVLGDFIQARMSNKRWTPEDIAERLDVEPQFIEDLVEGHIPESRIDGVLVDDLAAALGYETNVLRIILGRDIVPTQPHSEPAAESDEPVEAVPDTEMEDSETILKLNSEMNRLLDDITDHLLGMVDRRYAPEVRTDEHQSKRHEFVLKQVQMVIAKHRTDVRRVQVLIDELNKIQDEDSTDDDREYIKLDIRRIIHHIESKNF